MARFAIALVLLTPIGLLTGGTDVFVRVALLGAGFVVMGRVLWFAVLRRLRRGGVLLEPTVILGGGQIGAEIAGALCEDRTYGAAPIGFVDSVSGNLPLPVLGEIEELDRVIDRYDVRRMIVAFGPARDASLVKALRSALQHDIEVHIVPRFFDCGVAPQGPDTDDVRGIVLYRVRRAALRAPAWMFKRVLDVAVAGAVLGLSAPILGLVALAVKATSLGPILFRQRRVGQDGQEFELLKFRTLRHNNQSDTQWSVIGDARLTPIGRLLRRTSLDELPQLWNVVRGDMSLIGARPERPFFVDRFSADIQGYKDRHRLPVGLTGWAQVNGLRGDTSIEARARLDNHYIENWSIWRDFVILGRTAAEVVRGARDPDRLTPLGSRAAPAWTRSVRFSFWRSRAWRRRRFLKETSGQEPRSRQGANGERRHRRRDHRSFVNNHNGGRTMVSESTEPSDLADLRRAFEARPAVERYDKSTGSSDFAALRRAFEARPAVERYDKSTGSSDFAALRRAFEARPAVERYDKSTGSSDFAALRGAFAAGAAVERYDNERGSVYKAHRVGIAVAAVAALAVLVSAAPFAAWPGAGGNHPAERRGVLERKSAVPSDAGTRSTSTNGTADPAPPPPPSAPFVATPGTTARVQVPQRPIPTPSDSEQPPGLAPPSDTPAPPAPVAPTPPPPPAPPPTSPTTTTPPTPPTMTPP